MQDFGADLAVLPADIDPDFVKPGDTHTLRMSIRHDDSHGYIFVNNYQRRLTMDAHKGVVLEGKTAGAPVVFPATDIESGEYAFYPYNMKLGEHFLVSALATPLCKLTVDGENVYVFYGDKDPQFTWGTTPAKVLMLTRKQALSAARVSLKSSENQATQEYLIFSDNFVWEEDGKLTVVGGEKTEIRTFPKLEENVIPEGFVESGVEGDLTIYTRDLTQSGSNTQGVTVTFSESAQTSESLSGKLVNSCGKQQALNGDEKIYEISVQYANAGKPLTGKERADGYDSILAFDYACDTMELYVDGRKINDYFYTGQKALLSLGYFDFPTKITAVLHPLHEGAHIYLQEWPKMENGSACRIEAIEVDEQIF